MSTAELPALSTPYPLRDEAVEHFRSNGWVKLSQVCAPGEVDAWGNAITEVAMRHNRETRPMEERDTYGRAFLQIMNLWRLDSKIEGFTLSPRFGQIAAALLGCERVRLYHDQALFKEPGGGHTPWHQDGYFWPVNHARAVTMWMPLVDVPAEMGTMSFADGSDHDGLISVGEGISDQTEAFYEGFVQGRGYKVTTSGAMNAGDATFHNGLTLHRAPGNPTDRVRAVMTVIYIDADETVREPANQNQANDLASWFPGLRPGDPVTSVLNPLI